MCGICGWFAFTPDRPLDPALATRMNNTLAHRGPDDAGVVTFDQAALAMRRLSIIDLATGHQPIANEGETCWVVFNGEIYNYRDLRRQLETHGYYFHTRSDTEVVLHAYEEWGQDCVRHLRGMFAIAIYDRRAPHANGNETDNGHAPTGGGRLFLARDRVGKKPLYYYHDDAHLLFASEIKALLVHPHVPRRVNHYAIPLYLTYGYVPAPLTMFEGIYELPPGHTLTVSDGKIAIDPYWDVANLHTDAEALSEQDYSHRLEELFEEAVRIRLMSDVPLGAFLSGGLDSTAIVACMTRLMDQPVKTFAIGFTDEPSFNELEYARLAARTYRTDHHEFMVQPNAVDLVRGLVWHYDQPFADSSAIPTYLVAKLTREHVTVALTGDGGDELFAGYERFAAARLAETYSRAPQFLRTALLRLLSTFPESTSYYSPVRRMRRFIEHAPLPLAQRYLSWVGIFHNGFLPELLRGSVDVDPVSHFTSYFHQVQGADLISQLLTVNAKTYLPGDLLVKADRMSMANSLEARSPFLDHELLEFAARIPSRLKLKGLTTKYIFKKAMKNLVPHEILHRKKHGFGVPVGRWFRTSLKDYVREVLLSPEALRRGYFREEAVRQLLDEHQAGKRDHSHRLWALLTFEVWHQVFLDRGA
jgi:asparagine synthase (glutamine-hydrolysing)